MKGIFTIYEKRSVGYKSLRTVYCRCLRLSHLCIGASNATQLSNASARAHYSAPVSELAHQTYVVARKVVIALIGGTVTLIGIAMIVLPGPAFIVLPAGLAILAIEFAWARRWLKKVKRMAHEAMEKMHHNSSQHPANHNAPHSATATPIASAPKQ